MKYLLILPIAVGMISTSCSSEQKTEQTPVAEETQTEDNPILGSWQLVSYMNADSSKWSSYPDQVVYQKHITPTHFTWYSYNNDEDKLTGIGGGTYAYANAIYTENIEFFMPPGSNELGQAIPFTVEMKEGKWYHTGYAKIMEIDETSGELVLADSSKIEEIWERVSEVSNGYQPGVNGSWNLVTYREGDRPTALEYPDFIKYIKLLTPTHFVWIQYNGDGDEVFAAGGGTYTLSEESYVENVQMMYPSGSGTVGSDIEFTYSMDSGRWNHMGYVNRININKEEKPREDLLIDEVWVKVR